MQTLRLDFHGVRGSVTCDHAAVADDLGRDFEYFLSGGAPDHFRVALRLAQPQPPPRRRPCLRTARCAAYDDGLVRRVDYHGAACAELDFRTETARIASQDPELLRELGYLLVLSRAGFLLDQKGMHRIHALGAELRGTGLLLLLPCGGGKSAMCLELLRRSEAKVLSEDTPLLSEDGLMRPFPLRLGLCPGEDVSDVPAASLRSMRRREHGEKLLVDLAYYRGRVSGPVRPRLLILGARGAAGSRRASRVEAVPALLASLVAGVGVPQLLEFMWRTDAAGAAALARIALRRFRAASRLLSSCSVARLRLGTDRARNLETLESLVI